MTQSIELTSHRSSGRLPAKWMTALLASCSVFGLGVALAQSEPATDVAPATADASSQTTGPVLTENPPQRYTVREGDTLWGIASLYLRDPWLWPEIWYVNPQVENPHLIYPGDVLSLAYGADGRPQVTIAERANLNTTRLSPQMRSQPLKGAILAIPYEAIAAFISKASILEKDQFKDAPHVLSSREQHLLAAPGNTIYASGKVSENVGTRYSIVHIGESLRDPDDNDVVGYIGHYAASARVTRGGTPVTLEITEAQRETLDGDKLFPSDVEIGMDFIPHVPERDVEGRIISLINGIVMTGQYQVVVINRGTRHGLQAGHVLGIYQAGNTVRDKAGGKGLRGAKVKLPDERSGTFMVFRTYDRISYGLIMNSQRPVRELDRVSSL